MICAYKGYVDFLIDTDRFQIRVYPYLDDHEKYEFIGIFDKDLKGLTFPIICMKKSRNPLLNRVNEKQPAIESLRLILYCYKCSSLPNKIRIPKRFSINSGANDINITVDNDSIFINGHSIC